MKIVAAYLLALLGGKAAPSPDDIKSILGSVGADADDDMLDFFFKELGGKDINDVLALGREKFSVGGGGGGGGGGGIAVVAGGGGGGGAGAPVAEETKEETKEEKKEEEESDEDMGFSLFD